MNNKSTFNDAFLFQLDPRIQATSFFLGSWPLSNVLLKNDENYPWFLLVPRRSDIEEIYQLDAQDQLLLMQEINQLSLLVKNYYQPKKINVASLGNIVRQLHIHCVARTEQDSLWPQGIWQSSYQSTPYPEAVLQTMLPRFEELVSQGNKYFSSLL